MNVQVEILVSRQPTAQDLNRIKATAAALTDDRESITVTSDGFPRRGNFYEVEVRNQKPGVCKGLNSGS